jgi:hypothetical protein
MIGVHRNGSSVAQAHKYVGPTDALIVTRLPEVYMVKPPSADGNIWKRKVIR